MACHVMNRLRPDYANYGQAGEYRFYKINMLLRDNIGAPRVNMPGCHVVIIL